MDQRILFRLGLDSSEVFGDLQQLQTALAGLGERIQSSLNPGQAQQAWTDIQSTLADIVGLGETDFLANFDSREMSDFGEELERAFAVFRDGGVEGIDDIRTNYRALINDLKLMGELAFDPLDRAAETTVGHIQNAFTNFVRTGELDFQRLATSIVTSLANIAFEKYLKEPLEGIFDGLFQTLIGSGGTSGDGGGGGGGIAGFIGSLIGGAVRSFTGGGRALGGSVTGGRPYVVGEMGRELFVPETSGRIVPNNAMGGSIVFNVQAKDADSFRRSESQIAAMLHRVASRGNRNL